MSDFDFQRPRTRKPRPEPSSKLPVFIIGVLAILLLAGGVVATWLAMRGPATTVAQGNTGTTQRTPATQRSAQPTQRVTPTQRQPDAAEIDRQRKEREEADRLRKVEEAKAAKIAEKKKWQDAAEKKLATFGGQEEQLLRRLYERIRDEKFSVGDLGPTDRSLMVQNFSWLSTEWLYRHIIEHFQQNDGGEIASNFSVTDQKKQNRIMLALFFHDPQEVRSLAEISRIAKQGGGFASLNPTLKATMRKDFKMVTSIITE